MRSASGERDAKRSQARPEDAFGRRTGMEEDHRYNSEHRRSSGESHNSEESHSPEHHSFEYALRWGIRCRGQGVDVKGRWRISQRGLGRTSDLLGDHLLMEWRRTMRAGKGSSGCTSIGLELLLELRDYEREPRLLVKLADTGRVIQALKRATVAILDIFKLHGSHEAETWRQQLEAERTQRLRLYEELFHDEERLGAELGDEYQQVELQTLLKYGFNKYRDVLTPGELNAMAATFDASVRLSGIVIAGLPAWFATTEREWTDARKVYIAEGEEACLREASISSMLQHPNVGKFYGACHVGENPFHIREGDARMIRREIMTWRLCLGWARGILYIHERGLVYKRLTRDHLAIGGKGNLSALGLVWSSTTDEYRGALGEHTASMPSSPDPSMSNDVMRLGVEVFGYLTEYRHQECHHREANSDHKDQERSETKSLPDTKPEFLNDDEWHLLQGMCATDPADRISMLDVVHQMKALADQEESSSDPRVVEPTRMETVNDVRHYQIASLGQTLEEVLKDAASCCDDADPEIADVHRPVCDRLTDVYQQLLASTAPLPLRLLDQLSDIVQRFAVTLERRDGYNYSYSYSYSQSQKSVGALCASRTVAGRNYGLHYDIDRLLRDYCAEGLDSSSAVHRWQPSWKEVRERQRQTLQTWVEDPTPILKCMESEASRSEALALLRSEAESTGLQVRGALPALPRWFVASHRVQIGKHLADGSFGAVHEGMYVDTPVVVKQVLMVEMGAEERHQFLQEADLWSSLNHQNLIKLYGACHEGRPFFVCERAMGGTIVEYGRENPAYIWYRLREASRGLQHLHEHGIVHGDLKGNNILIGDDEMAKLADFGLSFAAKQTDACTAADGGALGAFRWKAPEVLRGGKATFASDIYSFGMCIIEAVTGQFPWGNLIPDAAVKCNVVERKLLPQRPKVFTDKQWDLVTRMCCYDPKERITAGSLVNLLHAL